MALRYSPDEAAYQLMTTPGASLNIRMGIDSDGLPECQTFGNRAGVLSLANVLLWLHANAWRRELLSLAELPLVRIEGSLSVCLRVNDAEETERDGLIRRTDRGEQFEWVISEDDLEQVTLRIHSLVCEMIDRAAQFLRRGRSGRDAAQSAGEGTLVLGTNKSTRVSFIRDDESSDRYFLVIESNRGLLIRFTVAGEDVTHLSEALRQVTEDLHDQS